jgi:putative heme-binding domain-containing protein
LGFGASADDPATERASFRLAPGFEINLFASERDGVVKPIQSRFDARGRLWVIGSTVYPQLKPGEVPNDKVVILEDTDGDGRADKSTVFADGLTIPTGLEITRDGCLVGNSTELLRLRDTDGDDKADAREVVLRGFGTGDNHQNINSFAWGPGGELWFSQGLHSYSRVETPWGIERLDAAGIWRLWPRRFRLDAFFGHELPPHNPWGFVFDDWNQLFVLAGNGHGIYWPVPISIRGHRITPLEQLWRDYRGRKLCGGDICGNAHFPSEWQGAMFAGGFMNNAVYALRISDDGAAFQVDDLWVEAQSAAAPSLAKQVNDATPSPPPPANRQPFLTSTSTSFRPVDVKFGPDGALYLTDWYNPIIGHYQSSFRHPDRDKTHGRIWRITAKGRPLVQPPRLVGAPVVELLDHLKSTDRFTRHQAKRVLAELDTAAVTNALTRWVARLDITDPRLERHLMEALGVYEAHEVVEPTLLARLCQARDFRARAYAAGVIAHWQDRLEDPLALLRLLAFDEHPRVRTAAVVACAYVPRPDAVTVALTSVDVAASRESAATSPPKERAALSRDTAPGLPAAEPLERFLDYALRQCVFVLKQHWLPAFQSGQLDLAQHPARLEFLVKADATPDTTRVVRSMLKQPNLPPANREALLNVLAEAGDADDLALLLQPATFTSGPAYDAAMHARVLASLERASRLRSLRPAGDFVQALGELFKPGFQPPKNRELRMAVLRLVALWKVDPLRAHANFAAFCGPNDPELAVAGAMTLAALGGEAALNDLAELARPTRALSERIAGVVGLAQLDPARAASVAAGILSGDANETALARLLSAVTARKASADALATALANQVPARDTARLALRWLNSAGVQHKALAAAFTAAAGLDAEPLQATPEFVTALAAEVRTQGDVARGREIFLRADLACLSCHRVGEEGGTTGPDLNAIGSGQPLDFIIGAVLEPNREVKEGFEAIEVTMKDGESYTGYRVRTANESEVTLRETTRNELIRLRRDAVKEITPRGSIMPSGLVNHLTRAELRDLFRFLAELGQARP